MKPDEQMSVTRSAAVVKSVRERGPAVSAAHELTVEVPDGVCEISNVVSPLFKAYRNIQISVGICEEGVSSVAVSVDTVSSGYAQFESTAKLFINGVFVSSCTKEHSSILLHAKFSEFAAALVGRSVVIRAEVTEQPIIQRTINKAVLQNEGDDDAAKENGEGDDDAAKEIGEEDVDAVGGVCTA